jgi:outer membrane lipoprotein-sorting protein
MRTALAGAFLVLFSLTVSAQAQPDAAEILKKVGETCKDVKQYEIEADMNLPDPETKKNLSGYLRLVFRTPDRYRTEMKGSFLNIGVQPDEGIPEEMLDVYDGSNLWVYVPKTNEYRVYVTPDLPRDGSPEATDLYMGIGLYRHAGEFGGQPKFLREERIAAGGGTADCFVIERPLQGTASMTLWIDKHNFNVLRVDGSDASEVFRTVKLDEPLSDDLFKFEPPPGAKKLD